MSTASTSTPNTTNNIPAQDPLVKQDVKTVWGDWLNSWSWSYWTTFTTQYDLSLPSARRMSEKIGKYALDGDDTYMFWAAEEFDVKDGQHIHALLKTNLTWDQVRRFGLKRGRCYIETYDPKLGAGHYVSKYISKRMTDYDWIKGSRQIDMFKRRVLK